MAWSADELIAAYRLTATPQLVAQSLADAVERINRWLYLPAQGGLVRWTWQGRYWNFDQRRLVGLPDQCVALRQVSVGGVEAGAGEYFLTNRGWSIQRYWPVGYEWGDLTAEGQVWDDTARRDTLTASLALEQMGYDAMEQGRGWRLLLADMQGPSGRGRLPDAREIIQVGQEGQPAYTARVIHYGVQTAGSPLSLRGLAESTSPEFGLPTWGGLMLVTVARDEAEPITELLIGGIDQLPAFRSETLITGGQRLVVWRSRLAWDGAVASGASVRVG